MAADDDRLERLEKRIGALEDQIAIYQLLMTYGPSVLSPNPLHCEPFRVMAGIPQVEGAPAFRPGIARFPTALFEKADRVPMELNRRV